MTRKSKATVTNVRQADENHRVLTLMGGGGSYRRQPCPDCPWRKDAVGEFPPEAFRLSANTAADMAQETFGCHASGANKPATCAGFLLRGAEDNMRIRLDQITGRLDLSEVHDGGHELWDSYFEMAVANGVSPDDPALDQCKVKQREID